MLKPALMYKEKIEKCFAEIMYSEDFFYYVGWAHCHYLPEIKPEDNRYQWAVVDGYDKDIVERFLTGNDEHQEKVIGYISYRVNPDVDSVSQFGVISFDKGNPIVGRDLYRIIKNLVKRYRRIEWHMIGGNPIEHNYDRICAKFNGNKVVLHDVCKDNNGIFRDNVIYEILSKGDVRQ